MKPTTLIYPITPEAQRRLTVTWESLRAKAQEKGIVLAPDGSFSGRATGKVTLACDRISVLITDKPFFISIGSIDKELRRLFS